MPTREKNIIGFARGAIDFKVKNNGYSADVVVAIKNNAALLYDLVNIKSKNIADEPVSSPEKSKHLAQNSPTNNSIPDSDENVNKNSLKFSLKTVPTSEEIDNNTHFVANMDYVAHLEGTELAKSDTNLIEQVNEFFDSVGNKITNDYGEIELKKTVSEEIKQLRLKLFPPPMI